MRILKLNLSHKNRLGEGVSAFIIKHPHIDRFYGRDNLVLKVFKQPAKNFARAWWGRRMDKPNLINALGESRSDANLMENTVVQNLAHYEGLAPRVYDLIFVEDSRTGFTYPAQVTQYIQGGYDKETDVAISRIKGFFNKHGIYTRDIKGKDIFKEQLVDFDGFVLPDGYEEQLRRKAAEIAHFNNPGDPAYQTIDRLKLKGLRDWVGGEYGDYRVDMLRLNETIFKDKNVLDVGCNLGLYCMEADLRGAKRVVGVDSPETIKIAREISNYLGHFNVDLIGTDLRKSFDAVPKMNYDVVFHLAMDAHIGNLRGEVLDMCNDIFIYESHRDADPEERAKALKRKMKTVTYLGPFQDHGGGTRHQFYCHKNK